MLSCSLEIKVVGIQLSSSSRLQDGTSNPPCNLPHIFHMRIGHTSMFSAPFSIIPMVPQILTKCPLVCMLLQYTHGLLILCAKYFIFIRGGLYSYQNFHLCCSSNYACHLLMAILVVWYKVFLLHIVSLY